MKNMINKFQKFEKFRDEFQKLSKDKQVKIFNEFCNRNGFKDEKIYPMEELDEVFSGVSPSEMWDIISGNYNRIDKSDDYFIDTIGAFKTFNNPYKGIIWEHIGGIYKQTDLWENEINI